MHTLIVVSHPLENSLTHSVANAIAEEIAGAGPQNTLEIADLTREGFNPTFNAADMAAFQLTAPVPEDVAAEQARLDAADALVLVFPIYWWTMPGLLKGWIDRVFSNGWAYEESAEGRVIKKLGHLPVHLVGLGAATQKTYQKHGFFDAYNTQIAKGIFDYCGAPVVTNATLMLPDLGTPAASIQAAREIGQRIAAQA